MVRLITHSRLLSLVSQPIGAWRCVLIQCTFVVEYTFKYFEVFVYSCFCFELVFKIFLVLFLSYLLFKSMFFNLTASLVSYLSVCRILLVEVYCPPYVTCGSRKTSWDGPVNKKYLFNSGQHASILLHKSEFEYCWSLQL